MVKYMAKKNNYKKPEVSIYGTVKEITQGEGGPNEGEPSKDPSAA